MNIVEGDYIRKKKFYGLIRKHFDSFNIGSEYDCRADCNFSVDFIEHLFTKVEKFEDKHLFGLINHIHTRNLYSILIEPNDGAYPREEIWKGHWRDIKIHFPERRENEILNSLNNFACDYKIMTKCNVVLVRE